jgi:hypothetical protein
MAEYAVPILPSRDLHETLDFYERLGFETRGAPIDRYGYLILRRGSIELHSRDAPDVDPLSTASSCHVRVEDADALFRERDEIGVPPGEATGRRLAPPRDTG